METRINWELLAEILRKIPRDEYYRTSERVFGKNPRASLLNDLDNLYHAGFIDFAAGIPKDGWPANRICIRRRD